MTWINEKLWELAVWGRRWRTLNLKSAYRKTAYRIIHNPRPTQSVKEAKHRSKGNIEPSDPFTCSQDNRHFRDTHEETEGYSPFWAGYSWALLTPCGSRCTRLREQGSVQLQLEARASLSSGTWSQFPLAQLLAYFISSLLRH